MPVELERLPGSNWLCIDFGTSAIAAAVGGGVYESVRIVPLQNVSVRKDGRAYSSEDLRNPEAGTPFLPSWVICNADLRSEAIGKEDGWRPGFPHFRPASLNPGDPSFLGLPALTSQLTEIPGRVIFSLKSWLGKGARNIRLQEEVRFLRNGHLVKDRVLPLDAVVESGFAALAEAYLREHGAEQIVICHPNTFTERHRQRLHTIASRALMKTFGISSQKHIRLLSESDAVAYYYCNQRMRQHPRDGTERLLVYDFGAGTLDISIISLEWNRDPFYPKKWVIEARLGVPVAGNHLDEILARIVDELLRDSQVMNHPELQYVYPVVAEAPASGGMEEGYREAINELHEALKTAKHSWGGVTPLIVRVGGYKGGFGVVRSESVAPKVPTNISDPNQPGIIADHDYLYLSIPAVLVRTHRRIAEYIEFVTKTVVDEALLAANLSPSDIATLIVSGRVSSGRVFGAAWKNDFRVRCVLIGRVLKL